MNCDCDCESVKKEVVFRSWLIIIWIMSTLLFVSSGIGRTKDEIDKLVKMHQTTTTAQVKVDN